MDATLTGPTTKAAHPGRGDPAFSLRPNRGRWDAMLARSTAALDAALRASLSADRGTAPLTQWQRARAAGAALAGLGGIGGLAALAGFRPELGAAAPAVLAAAVVAAGLPVALCIRRAVVGADRGSAEAAAAEATSPEGRRSGRPGLLRRLTGPLRRPDRAARRLVRRQDRAVARTLADIALRERRLGERIAAGDAPRRGTAAPAPAAPVAPPARPAAQGAGQGTGDLPWALPRHVADALADLEARERLHAERASAARPTPARPHPAAASTALQRARRHERIRPRQTRTLIATADGRKLNAVITDVSQSGVAIDGNLPGLWIGSMVTVGSRRAKAVRVLPRGMAFEFSMPVPAEALTADFVL